MIDLRSDTVTRPSEAMRAAMAAADVGDDVYGEDPTVNRLEATAAGMVGKEAGLFVTSGTQSNLLALLSHCERGDEYIAGQSAHTYRYEGGGAAVLGSIQPQPLPFNDLGELDLDMVAATIKPRDFHFARTRLLCLENTQAGRALAPDYLEAAGRFAAGHGLRLHLDGARLFNAAAAVTRDVKDLCRRFDTVSLCLSKGLGAPVGSVLCGPADQLEEARRWRKVLGGGMRQAGVLAAAGLYALEHNTQRLGDDHRRAAALADGLRGMEGPSVVYQSTNMVFMDPGPKSTSTLVEDLKARGILISGSRLVTHLDIDDDDVAVTIEAMRACYA